MSNPTVTLETSHGSIVLELDADKAPKTVANFLSYARDGYFDGTIFHRVISNFMIQGGGFTPDMEQKKAKRPIRNEADNGLKNQRGTVAMNVVDNDFLDHVAKTPMGYGYCVFGQVVEGMDAVDAIRQVATGDSGHHQDVPKESVVIESATVQE